MTLKNTRKLNKQLNFHLMNKPLHFAIAANKATIQINVNNFIIFQIKYKL